MGPLFNRERIIYLTGLVILLVFIIGGFYALHRDSPISIVQLPPLDCDLRSGPCVLEMPSGDKLELKVKQTHMPVLTNLQMDVKVDEIGVKKMYIDFKGAEMDMGKYRYELQPQRQRNVYSAQTILPTCIEDKMIWNATLHIQTNKHNYQMAFTIVNERPTGNS